MCSRFLTIILLTLYVPLLGMMELEVLRSSPDEETPLFDKYRTPRKRQKKLSLKQRKRALFEAAKVGEVDTVRLLLSLGTPVAIKDATGNTPLHYAADGGHVDVVTLLLEKRRDERGLRKKFNKLKTEEMRNNDGFSPLHLAAQGGHLEVVQALYQYTEATERLFLWGECLTQDGEAAYELAVRNNHRDVVCFMLDTHRGAIPFESLKRAWFFAIGDDQYDMIRLLSEKYSRPWVFSFRLGLTSLQHALASGSIDTVAFLLAKGASPNDKRYAKEVSPLHYAAMRKEGAAECCELLLKAVILQEAEHDLIGWLNKKRKQGFDFEWNRNAVVHFLATYFLVKVKEMCATGLIIDRNLTPNRGISPEVAISLPDSSEPTPLESIVDPGFIHMYFPKLIKHWFVEELSSLSGETHASGKEELL